MSLYVKGSLEEVLEAAGAALANYCEPSGPRLLAHEEPHGFVIQEWGFQGPEPGKGRRLFSRSPKLEVRVSGTPEIAKSVNVTIHASSKEMVNDVLQSLEKRVGPIHDLVLYEDD